ncbi:MULTISPECIES: hypothetical protein [Salegentibacter]|nr:MULTISPECIES: hypothetical protein [Salegentibacter]
MEAKSKNRFSYTQAGVEIIFDATANSMTLKQGGGEFLFTKE